jgi:hypothetical protein
MKDWINIVSVGLAVWLCGGVGARAQTNLASPKTAAGTAEPGVVADSSVGTVSPTDAAVTREGQVLVPVKPTELNSVVGVEVDRPLLADRITLTPELKERLARFERYRLEYLRKQELLRKEYLSATDAERAKVRERIQSERDKWIEVSRALRQEFQDRQRELLGKLKEHQEVIRSTRENVRDAIRDQMLDQRRETRDKLKEEGRPR